MKKNLLLLSFVAIFSTTQAGDSYLNRFKNRFGLGTFNPDQDINEKRTTIYKIPKLADIGLEEYPSSYRPKGYSEGPRLFEKGYEYRNLGFDVNDVNYQDKEIKRDSITPTSVQGLVRVSRHEGRYEGARDTALAGAGAAAVAGLGYGLYQLYNWYRGDLHALKRTVDTARSALAKAINIVEKMPKQGSKILITDIYDTKKTLDAIHKSIVEEENHRKKK